VHILVQTVAVMRRLDHIANRTGKPTRILLDGQQTKRISATEAGGKLRTPSPQSGCRPPNQALKMRGDDPAGVIGRHVIAKRGEFDGHDVVATG
jgi:hypothetical protein